MSYLMITDRKINLFQRSINRRREKEGGEREKERERERKRNVFLLATGSIYMKILFSEFVFLF